MTAKKKTQKGVGGRPGPGYDLEQKNALTREESLHLLGLIHARLTDNGDPDVAAAFLLLINVLAFEEDGRERFTVWCDARSMFALDISGPYYALEASLGGTLAELRKGGER